ncbi:hypothetical protein PCANC_07536 [Puccinia coronata f. sp. avenae]|uniref:Uncharacterized protein n=1 Tax=Puccinia coronata f. sp. avenae TaxID=200324 RepID=A0A2N5VSI4_9BASI|nr:hypothetical protein PCANC_07536 [Puccinia coronata f. sp. avenae]
MSRAFDEAKDTPNSPEPNKGSVPAIGVNKCKLCSGIMTKELSTYPAFPPQNSKPALLTDQLTPTHLANQLTILSSKPSPVHSHILSNAISPLLSCPPNSRNMSSGNLYTMADFSLYLMPKTTTAPLCLPCQCDTLPSVFEDNEGDQVGKGVRSKATKLLYKICARVTFPSRVKSSSPPSANLFSPSRLCSFTLSRRTSSLRSNSLLSHKS